MKNPRLLLLAGMLVSTSAFAAPRSETNINPVWKFHLGDPGASFKSVAFNDSAWEDIALPHTLKEVSLDLDGNKDRNTQATFHRYVGYYRKTLDMPSKPAGRNFFLQFQGAMQTLELWVNGTPVGKYERSGYDSFHFDITDELKAGKNIIAIKVDNQVNEVTPPDGKNKAKDFILFGGLYRDVSMVSTSKIYVNFPWEAHDAGVRITFPRVSESSSSIKIETTVKNDFGKSQNVRIETRIKDAQGTSVATLKGNVRISADSTATLTQDFNNLKGITLWNTDRPALYTAESTVIANGKTMDFVSTRFGVRSIEFTEDKGFFLNGKHLKLQGSNRHQTWPFIGNAVPNSLHRRDAEIIKATGMNWVRLSHYPHDPDFLDACDEIGLMLLEEGPTWMGGSNEEWMNNLYYSFTSMIRRDRNHPSIIVWNACINHSRLEERLAKICKEEDYRPTGAEMPKTPMDFSHGKISGGGALTIEYTGHTYPRGRGNLQVTKEGAVDGEWQVAKRHWEHVNASYLKEDNAGMAVWCMFDYNTFHNENEQGMVWHGISDLVRIPKHSYFWYTAELTSDPMAYIINYQKGKVCVFSNCEQIELFQDTGSGFKSVGKKKPMEGFVLNSPPFDFDVAPGVIALKAIGFKDAQKPVEVIWRKPGLPKAINLKADSKTILADGSDMTRIVATIVDSSGTAVEGLASRVHFKVEGNGTIVGDNPAPIRNGKAVVLVRAHYSLGEIQVEATSPELKSDSVSITCTKAADNVLFPSTLPAFKAAKPMDRIESVWLSDLSWRFFQSKSRTLDAFKELEINGETYTHGLYAKAPAQVIYSLGGLYKIFTVTLVAMNGNTSYKIFLDGKEFCSKQKLEKDLTIEVPLEGVQSMRLLATKSINTQPDAAWAKAKLYYGCSTQVDKAPLFDKTRLVDVGAIQEKDPAPDPVRFTSVKGAKEGSYVTSNIVMISGDAKSYPISVKDCEYRIYSGPWAKKSGQVKSGDSLTLRVRVQKKKTTANVRIGGFSTTFEVIQK